MGDPNYEKPEPSLGDAAHTAIRVALSVVPVVGGPAVELFNALITAPLEKRRDETIASMIDGLLTLEQKVEGFNAAKLAEDETFITTMLQAITASVRTHQAEKREALRNAVLNAALPNAPEEDLQLMFLRWVDALTTWHLRLLKYFADPMQWFKDHSQPIPNISMGSPQRALAQAFPDLDEDIGKQMLREIEAMGLVSIVASLNTMMSGQGVFESRITGLGKQFLDFITDPLHA